MSRHDSKRNLHEWARQLIDKERIEGLAHDERLWLGDHLAGCETCGGRAAATDAAVRALKSVSVQVPRGLAASTTLRVHEEATKLKHQRARKLALIAGCAVSWIAGVASAPLVWRLCEWVGTTFDLPKIVWELGFVSWWLAPAAFVGLVILWVSERTQRDELKGWVETGSRSNKL